MARREFIKDALTVAALAPLARLAGTAEKGEGDDMDKRVIGTGPKVTRK